MLNNKNQSLFSRQDNKPLADRLRPSDFSTFYGQDNIIADGKILKTMIEKDTLSSMVFWGPPGCGKTTTAKIIAEKTSAKFFEFSAVNASIKEIKNVLESCGARANLGQRSVIFIDEIHRFNKMQQDVFLPYVERGDIILIGATTENPSFEINNALLSRMRVFIFNKLTTEELTHILHNAIQNGFPGIEIKIDDDDLHSIAVNSHGDARYAISTLEIIITNGEKKDNIITVSRELVRQCISPKNTMYDRDSEYHYNIISALHKSMRNSDPDAAVYWLATMLEAGEDPLYISRRLIRFASEDIGLADTKAITLATDAYTACHYIGMPECNTVLTETVIYLSLAPKSNSSHVAYEMAKKDISGQEVPLWLRNAATKLMKDTGYGKGYQYAHDYEQAVTGMQCLPDDLQGRTYYSPSDRGHEKELKERLERIKAWKTRHKE